MPQTQPYNKVALITKSDTVNIPEIETYGLTHAVYVGGAGIVVAVLQDDSTAQFTCVAGQTLLLAIKRVNSTTTTATLMNALWQV